MFVFQRLSPLRCFWLIAAAALTLSLSELQAAPGKAVERGKPTLTGIVSIREPTKSNDLALLEWSSPYRITRLLRPGERDGECEVLSISPETAKVVLRGASDNEQFELALVDPGPAPTEPICLKFRNGDLLSAFDIYQNLANRTVLRPNAIPISRLTTTIEAATQIEAAQQLEKLFQSQDLVVRHRTDQFSLIIQTAQSMVLDSIPDPPLPAREASGNPVFPPGLIKFQDADLLNVLAVYQDMTGRTVIRPRLPGQKISVKTQTALSKEQAIWVLDTLFHLGGVKMIPEADKFVFAVPPEQTNSLPHFDRQAAFAAINPAAPPPFSTSGLFRLVDGNAQTFLDMYAQVTSRQARPLSPELSKQLQSLRFTVRGQTTFDQAEVIYAFQALASVNGLALENVGASECRLVARPE